MKKNIFIILLLCLVSVLYAQEEEEIGYSEEPEETEEVEDTGPFVPRFSLGLEINVGFPLEDFNENLEGVSLGFGGEFLIRTNRKSTVPVLAGISMRGAIYDSESQNQIILIDGYTIDARLTTRNSIFMGHGVMRILPPVNLPVQPYFDGMIGFKNLFTRTTLEDRDAFEEDDTIDSYIEQGDWAFSFGGAAGFQVIIGGNDEVFILFDVRCSYLKGNAADYLVRRTDITGQIDSTIDAFEERNSTTDMLIPQIGVSFVF